MTESFTVSAVLTASAEKIFRAWLNSREHSAFTGSPAVISSRKGAKFTAWDGYIMGKNIDLKPFHKISQTWRTTEFKEDDPDSLLEITLEELKGKTKIILKHSKIPVGQAASYKQGWSDFYFAPMKKYFG